MRKPDEVALYAELQRIHGGPYKNGEPGGVPFADEIGERLGIHYKRTHALLEKWSRVGWWNSGVSLRSGWFEPGAPGEIEP